jgi:hypothetical protein
MKQVKSQLEIRERRIFLYSLLSYLLCACPVSIAPSAFQGPPRLPRTPAAVSISGGKDGCTQEAKKNTAEVKLFAWCLFFHTRA